MKFSFKRFALSAALGAGAAACSSTPSVDLSATIHGTVTDRGSGMPLKGVTITSRPETETVMTGADGTYMLAAGVKLRQTYQLTASLLTYQTETATVSTTDRSNQADIKLPLAIACITGQSRCATDGTQAIETCDARGSGFTRMDCPSGQMCDPSHGPTDIRCGAPVDLVINKTGGGMGLVISMPKGIDCGTTCRASFPQGALVTLSAGPFALSSFASWSGDCSGTSSMCTITMDRMRTVGAQFSTTGALLHVHKTGRGIVQSVGGAIDCGDQCGDITVPFAKGTVVDLVVSTEAPSVFVGWGMDCADRMTMTDCPVHMNDNHSVEVTFMTPQFSLDVTRAGMGAGVVKSQPSGIDCGATCRHDFDIGTDVVLTAMPAARTTFAWSGDCTGTSTCTLHMTANHNVTATFTGVSFPINVTRMGSGTVTSTPSGINCGATCTGTFGQGDMVTLSANPAPGSTFSGWGGDCMASGTAATCMLTVDAAKNVTATFAAGMYPLTIVATGPGTVSSNPAGIACPPTCMASFSGGAPVTLTANPTAPNLFGSWGGACASSGTSPTCMLNLTGAATVNAGFDPFYLHPFAPDASCTTLLHFDGATPLAQACGAGGPAVETGTFAATPSRTSFLIDARHSTDTGENVFVDTQKPGPMPPSATVEMTINKMGVAYNARTYAVLYSDEDNNSPIPHGMRLIVYDDGRLGAETSDAGGLRTAAQTAAGLIADNQWYFVAVTLSGTNGIALYVDGTQVKTSTTPMHWTQSSSTAYVGAERNGAGAGIYRFNGTFDEVRVSNVLRY